MKNKMKTVEIKLEDCIFINNEQERDEAIKQLQAMKFEPEYPMSWEDLKGHSFEPKGFENVPKKYLALRKLEQLRDEWNRIDGFEVDWSKDTQRKCTIRFYRNNIDVSSAVNYQRLLYFKTSETRNLFAETFEDLIEQAKPLL